jgi:DNA-binding ferritin-like protein
MKEEIILHFVHCQAQIRFNHWQTQNYVMHKYLGKLYDKLNESIDEFIETMIGKPEYGRPDYQDTFSIEFDNPATNDIYEYLSQFKDFLYQLTQALDPVKDTDLLTIRDTILGDVNHTLYFLTLNK